MLYYYMTTAPDTHILSKCGSDGIYGWSADRISIIAYAYTMWLFEGSDYAIYSIECNNMNDFKKHLFDRELLLSYSDIDKYHILLFEGGFQSIQAMTKENWELIDIDGGIIKDVVLSDGIERMLNFCGILRIYMPNLKDEVRYIEHAIHKVCYNYIPSDETERDEIIGRFNIVWLTDILFGDGINTTVHIYELNDKEFWEHCRIVEL